MKKSFTILFALLASLNSNAQSFEWAYTTGYPNKSFLTSVKKDHNNDIYLSTYIDSSSQILNTRIEKRTASNTILWHFDFTGGAVIRDVEINSQNHAVVAGYYMDSLIIGVDTLRSPLMTSTFLVEFLDNGNIFWTESFNPANDFFIPIDLFIDVNDNIYLTAELGGFSAHGFTSFHKLDVWGVPMLDEFNDNTEVRTFSHIVADAHGNVYLSGTCGNFATFDSLTPDSSWSYQNFLVKYDSAFNAQWMLNRPYITFDHNNGLGSDGQSLYWTFLESGLLDDSIKLVKTDFNGQIQIESPGPLVHTFFPPVVTSTDSSGNTVLASNIFNKIYLYRYDNSLQLQWQDSIWSSASGLNSDVLLSAYDSSFYLGSRFQSDSLFIDSILLLNPDPANFNAEVFFSKWGYHSTVNIADLKNYQLLKLFPNPATDKFYFYYPEKYKTKISITDNLGRSLYNQEILQEGIHEIRLDQFSPGLYFINIQGKEFNYYQRLIIN